MNFRSCISRLYPLIKKKSQQIFIFFIGSYPHRIESEQENWDFIKNIYNFNLDVYKIYIDNFYGKETESSIKNRLGDCIIYPENIKEYEYNQIIEFAHIAGLLSHSLTFIFEFTSIDREQFYIKENNTSYLYISPFECLGNTKEILYNPLILKNNKLFFIYKPLNLDNFNEELCSLFNNPIDCNFNKLMFITETLKKKLDEIEKIHRLLLNYIERKDVFDVKYEITFTKKEDYFYPSIDCLKKRMIGYNYNQSNLLINDFLESDEINLEIFLKKKIEFIFSYVLLYKNMVDKNINNKNLDNITFNDSKDIFQIIQDFKKIFN